MIFSCSQETELATVATMNYAQIALRVILFIAGLNLFTQALRAIPGLDNSSSAAPKDLLEAFWRLLDTMGIHSYDPEAENKGLHWSQIILNLVFGFLVVVILGACNAWGEEGCIANVLNGRTAVARSFARGSGVEALVKAAGQEEALSSLGSINQ